MTPVDTARAALLRALDALDTAAAELDSGPPTRVDLVVIYSVGREVEDAWEEVRGWASTPGPKWVHSAMLRRAADANDVSDIAVDDE